MKRRQSPTALREGPRRAYRGRGGVGCWGDRLRVGPAEILLAGVLVVLSVFVGWLVWRAFLWLVQAGTFENIGGILGMILFGGYLFLVGAFVLALILGTFLNIFGG